MEDEEKKENEEMEETKEIIQDPIQVKKEPKNNSKTIIIILSIVIVILVALLLLVLLGGKGKSEDKKEEENTEEKEDITDKEIGIDNLKSKDAKMYFNKYIVNYETNKIVDLDGEYLAEPSEGKILREGVNNSLILIYYDTVNNVTNVQRIIGEAVVEYDYEGMASPILDTKTNRVIGFVEEKKDHDELNLFTDKDVEVINLKDSHFYTFSLGAGEDKKVYDSRYIVTSATTSELSAHGLYDIKDKKVLIENEYTGIEYLHDDIFVAIKDDYSGVINKNNKVLLDFDYDSISYSNGLYFVAKDNTLDILDSDFNSINAQTEIDNLKSYTYNPCCGTINPYKLIKYKDYVVIGTIDPYENDDYEYTVIDKKGNKTLLGKGDVAVVNNYLITSKSDDTKITVYDSDLKEKYVLTANQKGTYLRDATIFLDKVLSLGGTKFFNFPDGKEKSSVSPIRRTSQEYEVRIDFKDGYGTVTVSKDEEVLATLDNVSVDAFLKAENNGITITKTHFIFNAGNSLIILKKQEN